MMVAYSFKPQFADPISDNRKSQTIRAIGKRRHVKEGERLQLYTGMRTKHCRLIAEAVCTGISEIMIANDKEGIAAIAINGIHLTEAEKQRLARDDGFFSLEEMSAFWKENQREGAFFGLLICWELLKDTEDAAA